MLDLKIYVLRRECGLSEIAGERDGREDELRRLNGLERGGILPRGMSLVMPGEGLRPRREKELYFTTVGAASRCPGRLSFVSAEFGPQAEPELEAAFRDFASGRDIWEYFSF